MDFFLALLISGLLSGSVYALVGAAFVVVYRASSVLNFSLGEWVSLGARLTGVGYQTIGLPLVGAMAVALGVVAALAALFNRVVIQRLVGRPMVTVVVATLALGVFMRGGGAITMSGLPAEIPEVFGSDLLWWGDVPIPPARLLSSGIALVLVGLVMAFFRYSRAGIAIRAIADDPQAATVVGISVGRYLGLSWVLSAFICVAGGVLWSIDGLGGFGMGLVLVKVLPVVVIGGLTSFAGAFVAALFIGVAENMAAGYLDPVIGTGSGSTIAAACVVLMLWFRPAGLFGQQTVSRV